MALPVITDTYRVFFKWSHAASGQSAGNVMHFRKTASNAGAVGALIDGNVTANMWNPTSSGASVTELHITPLDGSTATFIQTASGAKWTGGTTGDFIPGAAALVSLRTVRRGRSYRGRVYLPFVGESNQTNGALIAGSVTAVSTAWATFLNAMIAATCPLVVASYRLASATDVASTVAETLLGTQRRRQSRLR